MPIPRRLPRSGATRGGPRLLGVVAIAWACGLGGAARADEPPLDDATRHAARELAREGLELMQARRWEEALDRLRRAYEIFPAPTVALLQARAHVELGQLVEAAERYELARQPLPEDAPPAYLQAADNGVIELEALRPRIPKVSIFVGRIEDGVGPGEVVVELDGRPVPRALIGVPRTINPGPHRLRLLIGGHEYDARPFEIAEFERSQIVLRAEAPPPPPPPPVPAGIRFPGSTESALGWTSLGLGAAGIAVGVTAGAIAESHHAELTEACPSSVCSPDRHDQIDDFRTMRTVSSIGYIAGGVFLLTGGVLVWSAAQDLVPAETGVAVGLDGVGVVGKF